MSTPLSLDRDRILEHSGEIWEGLRNQRVFITGGTGFVGTWLLEAFIAANDRYRLDAQAIVLTRDPRSFAQRESRIAGHSSVRILQGDATTFDFPVDDVEYVIHAATERAFPADERNPVSTLDRDLLATRRVLDLAAQRGTRRFLFTSSGAVYGTAGGIDRIPETYPGAPDTTVERAVYGEGKRVSEFALTSYARVFGFDGVIARLFAFAGPRLPLDQGYAIGNFIGDALAGRPINVAGDGTAVRSYLYAGDLAVWLWAMLLRGRAGSVYNVGSPHGISILELANAVARVVSPGQRVSVGCKAIEGAAPSRYVPDTTRAKEELELTAWTPLEEAIRRTYDYELHRRTITAP